MKKHITCILVFIIVSCSSKHQAINHFINQRGNSPKYIISEKSENSGVRQLLKERSPVKESARDTVYTAQKSALFNERYNSDRNSDKWKNRDFNQNYDIKIIKSQILWSKENILKNEPSPIEVYSFSDEMKYGKYTVFSFDIYLFPIRTYVDGGVIVMREIDKKWQVIDTVRNDITLH